MHCDPSLEPSRQDGSNEGSQYMFLWRNIENYLLIIPILFYSTGRQGTTDDPCTLSYLEHCVTRTYPLMGL